jgi:hypothetical protein
MAGSVVVALRGDVADPAGDTWRRTYRFLLDRDDLRRGTFAPFLRASLRPIAIACFRLFTFRPDPLFSVPFFLRCIADLTRLPAALPYLAMGATMQMAC